MTQRSLIILKLLAFCLVLLVVRVVKTHHYSFFFLLWNLFLAWLPYKLISHYEKMKAGTGQFLILGLSILFLPNAPYIVTDLFHLTRNLLAPMWFDLLLILSFALLGLIFFVLTADRIFTILKPFFRSDFSFMCIKFLILLSNGYGIYLGRYLRFNSWDVVTNPGDLVLNMYDSVFDPGNFKETGAVTIAFSIFLYLIFEIFKAFKKELEPQNNELF